MTEGQKPQCVYRIVEHNETYRDSCEKGVYLTRVEAEEAKPEDGYAGWEKFSYTIEEVPYFKLSKSERKGLENKYKQ